MGTGAPGVESGIPRGWRWVALELVNSAPKEYVAFPEARRQPGLWAPSCQGRASVHGPTWAGGKGIRLWPCLALTPRESWPGPEQEPQAPPEAYLCVKPPSTLAGKAGSLRLSNYG